MIRKFIDYQAEAHLWITLTKGDYYPEIIEKASGLYQPILEKFGILLTSASSSENRLETISNEQEAWLRIQLLRIFRKYVSPSVPVEMLKRKRKLGEIILHFGKEFRPIREVREAFVSRPIRDEVLSVLLWEYKDRGKKGYDMSEHFFSLCRTYFPDLRLVGPERAGKDILMSELFSDYPNVHRPVDFAIYDDNHILAIGFIRYDSDRGGEPRG